MASDDLARRRARQLAAEAAAAAGPAGWFETLYAEAGDGAAVVPGGRPAGQSAPDAVGTSRGSTGRGGAGAGRP